MNKNVICVAMLLGLLASFSSVAMPVRYQLDFDGSIAGPHGVGEFMWESETLTMTGLQWNFQGKKGSWDDAELAIDAGGASRGAHLFSMLTRPGEFDPVFGGIPATSAPLLIRGEFPAERATFTIDGICRRDPVNGPFYMFFDDFDRCESAYWGIVTTRAASVPEPATLALFCAGMLGIAFSTNRPGFSWRIRN